MNMKNQLSISLFLKSLKRRLTPGFIPWMRRGFASPSPQKVKMRVLQRRSIPNATWIETGTYLGDTSKFLSNLGTKVLTIEPQEKLFLNAKRKLYKLKNIEFLHGTSEECLESAILKLTGEVNYWLDGHFSGDVTFKGSTLSPIKYELETIEKHLTSFKRIAIFIDDIRVFPIRENSGSDYPTVGWLIDWGLRNGFDYTIEHDIFIMIQP